MDFQLVSIHLSTANRHLCQTSGSCLSALGRDGRGIAVTFGDHMTLLDQPNLGQDPKSFSLLQQWWLCRCICLEKSCYFYWDLEQKNFFIINYVLLLIQMPCGDSLDLGQLKRKDSLPLQRSQKHSTIHPRVPSWCWTLLSGVDGNMLDYYLLFEDSVIMPEVRIVITERTFPWEFRPLSSAAFPSRPVGVEVLSWRRAYFWAGLGSTLLTYDMIKKNKIKKKREKSFWVVSTRCCSGFVWFPEALI